MNRFAKPLIVLLWTSALFWWGWNQYSELTGWAIAGVYTVLLFWAFVNMLLAVWLTRRIFLKGRLATMLLLAANIPALLGLGIEHLLAFRQFQNPISIFREPHRVLVDTLAYRFGVAPRRGDQVIGTRGYGLPARGQIIGISGDSILRTARGTDVCLYINNEFHGCGPNIMIPEETAEDLIPPGMVYWLPRVQLLPGLSDDKAAGPVQVSELMGMAVLTVQCPGLGEDTCFPFGLSVAHEERDSAPWTGMLLLSLFRVAIVGLLTIPLPGILLFPLLLKLAEKANPAVEGNPLRGNAKRVFDNLESRPDDRLLSLFLLSQGRGASNALARLYQTAIQRERLALADAIRAFQWIGEEGCGVKARCDFVLLTLKNPEMAQSLTDAAVSKLFEKVRDVPLDSTQQLIGVLVVAALFEDRGSSNAQTLWRRSYEALAAMRTAGFPETVGDASLIDELVAKAQATAPGNAAA